MNTRGVVYGRAGLPVLSAEESTALDRYAAEICGLPERLLLENAGRAAALIIDRLYPTGRVLAAVGSGHNGGDGLVLLRTLRAWGREVACLPVGSRHPDTELLHDYEITWLEPDLADSRELGGVIASADILVDAMLGTGASGAPREPMAAVIRAFNESGRPIIALDLPSGTDATTGALLSPAPGSAVRAETTITFGWPKSGLLLQPAREFAGRVIAVEIGFPPITELLPAISQGSAAGGTPPADRAVPGAELLTPGWARDRLPERPATAHKGTSGRLLIVAGNKGMAGAAIIAAEAALRAGAGYVWVASDPANRVPIQTALPEAIFIDRGDRDSLETAANSATALLAGPGIGTDETARGTLESVLTTMAGKPAILDADALTLIAGDPALLELASRGRELVLTPHPGECQRLTGLSVDEIRSDPIGVATSLAEDTGATVLLKGMPSVIAAPGCPTLINTVGSSDLARAGMGDQLAGVIGAFLAAAAAGPDRLPTGREAAGADPHDQVMLAKDAAALGLFYSGRAADLAALGRSLGPRDVSAALTQALADPGPVVPPLGLPFITFDQAPRW